MIVVPSLMILLTAWSWIVDEAPGFRIVVKRVDDRVELNESNKQTIFIVTSPGGIGSATIHRGAGGWPTDRELVLRLKLKGLEELRVHAKDIDWTLSVSSSDHKPRIRVSHGQQETEISDTQDRYWARVRTESFFEFKLPKELYANNPESLTIHWVDFFR